MCSVPPNNIYIITYTTMDNPNDTEKEVFTTPQKEPSKNDDTLNNTIDVSLCINATDDVESTTPNKISASSLANTRKPPPPSSIILSPSSNTRSHTSRKRSTPEKYVPSYNSSYKSRRISNSLIKHNSSKKKQKKSATKSTTPNSEVEIIINDDDSNEAEVTNATDNSFVMDLENEAVAKRLLSDDDPKNKVYSDAAIDSERCFYKALCDITPRSNRNIGWVGWTHGIFKVIKLSDYGKKYVNASK